MGKVYKLTWPYALFIHGRPPLPSSPLIPYFNHVHLTHHFHSHTSMFNDSWATALVRLSAVSHHVITLTSTLPFSDYPFLSNEKPMLIFFSPGWAPQYVAYTTSMEQLNQLSGRPQVFRQGCRA